MEQYRKHVYDMHGRNMEELFQISGQVLTVLMPTELDHHSSEKIRIGADQIIERHLIHQLVFDFKKTGFMDSSGIGVIMGRYKNIRLMGGTVIAINVNQRVKKILTLSGIYKLIEIYDELQYEKDRI